MLHATLKKLGRTVGRDAVVVFAYSGKKVELDTTVAQALSAPIVRALKTQMKNRQYKGTKKELLSIPGSGRSLVMVAGLGNEKKCHRDTIRQSCAHALTTLRSLNVQTVDVIVPTKEVGALTHDDMLVAATEGMLLGHYTFDKYMSKKKHPDVKDVCFRVASPNGETKKRFAQTKTIIAGTLLARDLSNDNSDSVHPESFAQTARDIAKTAGLKVTVFNEKRLEKEGLRLISAVGRASAFPPRLVFVEYTGDKTSKDVTALIGKGVTYDTGGVNLKPTQGGSLEEMHLDMSGAASVLATVKVLAELKLAVNVLAVMPLAENALSGNAYKPGSIITSYDGTAVEIGNTDAEGRLILADAMSYVVKNHKPTRLIDIATLTGMCTYTFSDVMSGLVSNDDKTAEALSAAGERTYERLWRLPLTDEYREMIKGDKGGDINNSGPRFAGTITAGAFLEHFAKNIPWTHIDASSAMQHNTHPYLPKRGTGYGVRLFVDYFIHKINR